MPYHLSIQRTQFDYHLPNKLMGLFEVTVSMHKFLHGIHLSTVISREDFPYDNL